MTLANTIISFDAFMKELYEGDEPVDVALKNAPTVKLMSKKGGFVGDGKPVPISYGAPPGRSRNFATAQTRAAAGGSKKKKAFVTSVEDYAVMTIEAKLLMAAATDLGSFAESKKWEIDQMLAELGANMSRSLFGTANGILAQTATVSAATDGTVTLIAADASKTRHLNVGAYIGAVQTLGGAARSGTAFIATIDRAGNSFTFTGTITSFAAGDYIFYDGDYTTAQDESLSGLPVWIPFTARTSTIFGMTRTDDVDRLSGIYLNDPTAPIHQNIGFLAEQVHAQSGGPEFRFVLNHLKFQELCWELGSKIIYDPGSEAVAGVKSVVVPYSRGIVKVHGDPDCPSSKGWLLDMDVCTLRYLGPGLIHLVNDDGLMATRAVNDDGLEVRARTFSQFICKAPGRCGVMEVG